jgi:hypothetical protein
MGHNLAFSDWINHAPHNRTNGSPSKAQPTVPPLSIITLNHFVKTWQSSGQGYRNIFPRFPNGLARGFSGDSGAIQNRTDGTIKRLSGAFLSEMQSGEEDQVIPHVRDVIPIGVVEPT